MCIVFLSCVYYIRFERGGQELFGIFIPRVRAPAGEAEPEEGDRNHVGFEASGVALMATEGVCFGVHICIRGKTRPTEGDFSDFFWVVLRLILS